MQAHVSGGQSISLDKLNDVSGFGEALAGTPYSFIKTEAGLSYTPTPAGATAAVASSGGVVNNANDQLQIKTDEPSGLGLSVDGLKVKLADESLVIDNTGLKLATRPSNQLALSEPSGLTKDADGVKIKLDAAAGGLKITDSGLSSKLTPVIHTDILDGFLLKREHLTEDDSGNLNAPTPTSGIVKAYGTFEAEDAAIDPGGYLFQAPGGYAPVISFDWSRSILPVQNFVLTFETNTIFRRGPRLVFYLTISQEYLLTIQLQSSSVIVMSGIGN